MPNLILPPPEPIETDTWNWHLEPFPTWEFGARRNPYEKPLFITHVIFKQIDPRVKRLWDIQLSVKHQL